ncbi:MAG TPA: hypothetical protein VEM93_02505 [Actinomycetota bacterium]|nr:hypothetical protein [Actinomycetota bacterium]
MTAELPDLPAFVPALVDGDGNGGERAERPPLSGNGDLRKEPDGDGHRRADSGAGAPVGAEDPQPRPDEERGAGPAG